MINHIYKIYIISTLFFLPIISAVINSRDYKVRFMWSEKSLTCPQFSQVISNPNFDINQPDEAPVDDYDDGRTLLHMAALFNNTNALQQLLSHPQIAIDITNNCGLTPLAYGAEAGSYEAIRMLLDANANFNKEDHDFLTPLHQAVLSNHEDVVQLLLTHEKSKDSIEINTQCTKEWSWSNSECAGDTPLHTAVKRCIEFAQKSQTNEDSIFYKQQYQNALEIVALLLNAGANTTLKNNQNETAEEHINLLF